MVMHLYAEPNFTAAYREVNADCCASSAGPFKLSVSNSVDPHQTAPLGAV